MRISLSLLLLVAMGTTAIADGLIRDGLGARVAGRGGTNLGFADSGTILHDNPGGVVNMDGNSLLEASFDIVIADIDYENRFGRADADGDPIPLGNVSLLRRYNEDIAYGIGVYTSGGFATDYSMNGPPAFPGPQKAKSFGALTRILPGVSARLTDRLSAGGTLGVGASHVELEGPYTLQTGPLASVPTRIDLQATGAAISWSLGLQYCLTPQTTLGATYQSETRLELDGTTRVEVPLAGMSAFETDLHMTWPRSVALGLRHEFCRHRVGAVDLIYYNWQNAFDEAGLYLSEASNPAFAAFGSTLEEQLPLRWRDTLSVRVGYEMLLHNCDKLRMGYVYHRNPIPSETLTPYIVTTVEHTLAVGYGTCIMGCEVDLGYQLMFAGRKSTDSSDLIGGDFDQSGVRTHAHIFYIGLIRR